jgi:hypothetical protein
VVRHVVRCLAVVAVVLLTACGDDKAGSAASAAMVASRETSAGQALSPTPYAPCPPAGCHSSTLFPSGSMIQAKEPL